jgi:dienelactone hydrolase
MTRRYAFLLATVFLLQAFIAGSHPANASTDSWVNDLFTALRDGQFSKATEHFDSTMKPAMTAVQLQQVWHRLIADKGTLQKWQILGRDQMVGIEVVRVELTFERGQLLALVPVRPQTGAIAGLYFKPAAGVPDQSWAPASPPYADASKFRAQAVTVGASPWKLPGTLTIPVGRGPFAAVVLLAGSGPVDRDETVGAEHVFKDLAEGLSSYGIVVLRYDTRTYAYRTLDPRKVTVDEEVIQDGAAAIGLMRATPEVAQDRIFVAGHSLGAMLAPEVARKAWPVAGIVMLAPAGRKLPAMILEQMKYLGEASPLELPELEREANEISTHEAPPTQDFLGAPASFYYDLDARDEVAIARGLDVPILILRGSRDYQVIDEDIRNWQTGLKDDAKVHVATLPELNHLFIAGSGQPGPAEYNTPGHVDPAVIQAIANFVANPSAPQTASN